MAVGDAIVFINSSTGVVQFQPAAGVEIIITELGAGSSYQLTDYSNDGTIYNNRGASNLVQGSRKLFITNSFFLRLNPSGDKAWYSGMQTK